MTADQSETTADTGSESDSDESEWAFQPDEAIRQEHEPHAPGGVPLGKSEYLIKRQLRQESDGKRFYHVEKEEGGTHLYAASEIEN